MIVVYLFVSALALVIFASDFVVVVVVVVVDRIAFARGKASAAVAVVFVSFSSIGSYAKCLRTCIDKKMVQIAQIATQNAIRIKNCANCARNHFIPASAGCLSSRESGETVWGNDFSPSNQ